MILDENMNILKEIAIEIDDIELYEDHLLRQGYILAQKGQNYHAVINNGVIYVQVMRDIYKLDGFKLVHIGTIPTIDGRSTALRSQIFALNNNLYVLNGTSYFILHNNKFKYLRELNHEYPFTSQHFICQFCDQMFVVQDLCVTRLLPDLSMPVIFQADSELNILMAQGGVIVVSSKIRNNVWAVNMLTGEYRQLDGEIKEKLKIQQAIRQYQPLSTAFTQGGNRERPFNEFQKNLRFGACGLELNCDIKKEIFGEEQVVAIQDKFVQYFSQTINQSYKQQVELLVKGTAIEKQFNQLLSQYQLVKEEQQQSIQDCQLMNVMKLKDNYYILIEDGYISIIDQNKLILKQIKVDFDYYAGKCESNNEDRINVKCLTKYMRHSIVINKGKLLIQAFDTIYELTNQNLVVFTKIPIYYSEIFAEYYNNPQIIYSADDKLYTKSNSKYIYTFDNNKFKYLECSPAYEQAEFCGQFIQWYGSNIYKLDNGKRIKIFQMQRQKSEIVFSSGGVCILQSKNRSQTLVIDIINGTYKQVDDDPRFYPSNIHSIVTLGYSGLQLQDGILIELFGEEYLELNKKIYDNYMQKQLSQYPSMAQELNSLLENIAQPYNIDGDQKQAKKTTDQLNACQLMNILKLNLNHGAFMAIEDNYLYIINSQGVVFEKYPVNYDLYSGYSNSKYRAGKLLSKYSFCHSVVICKGVIYLQRCEQIFRLYNLDLIFVANIPGFDFTCSADVQEPPQLFSSNDELFVFNHKGNIFKLVDNRFVFVENNDLCIFQFCNHLLQFDYCSKTVQKYPNCQILAELPLENDVNYHFCSGGLLILESQTKNPEHEDMLTQNETNKQKEFHVFDLADFKYIQVNEFKLDQVKLRPVLGNSGLKLRQKLIDEVIGNEFGKLSGECYSEFMKNQMTRFPCLNNQIKCLMTINTSIKFFEHALNSRFETVNQKINTIAEQTHGQIEKITCQMVILGTSANIISQKFLEAIPHELLQ
ncbi:Conserved_hypothetical protein [Hexamita inflata]|uniref:Uncharacterized protein n=1 Tax=Hexamita inflata TaxID=28002 RepID=A0AA86USU2_9EUKA|nr:Conserved hypothetical protein [Hexamita inflata]